MKNFKITLKLKEILTNDDFTIIVKTVSAKSKISALKKIRSFTNYDRFTIQSCELRK